VVSAHGLAVRRSRLASGRQHSFMSIKPWSDKNSSE
jgi:hypothetical protein